MKLILRQTLLTFLFALLALGQRAHAAHLVGGELTYECLGGDVYSINLTIYRDCNCVSCADFDNPAYITVFNSSGFVVQSLNMFDPVVVELPVSTEGLCLETGPDVCVERGFYQTTATLPPIPGGYQIVYQRCCRNNTIVNIIDPGGTGSTYVANLPESEFGACNNTSPVFNNFPPIVVCANSPLVVDNSAFDADGDSLVYSICEPFSGASVADPQPLTASPPPYTPISWLFPYSGADQLGGDPVMSIDPVTGEFTAFPSSTGQYVVGICVSEYRNGVLLSTNLRDFQFNVTECQIVLAQAGITTGSQTICPGQSVQLEGSAFGGNIIEWSPAASLDDAGILNPIATPTQTTTYTLTVINPFVGCEDSDQITIFVAGEVFADAGPDVEFCPGDAIQLGGGGTVGATFSWEPANGLSDPNSANPVAFPAQTTTYTLTVVDAEGVCIATDEVTLTLGSNANPGTMPEGPVAVCAGDATNVSSSGASLGEGDVLAYVLHTAPADALGTVLAVNASGGFFTNSSSPDIAAYATYYISAVAGPEGATPGVPDFNNPCTKVAPGTPVVFLAPVTFDIDEYCDFLTGDYHVTVMITGGYPQYDNNFTYSVSGDYFGELAYGETVEVLFAEGVTTSYSFTVTSDGFGCTGATAAEDFYCEKTPITLLNFSGKAQPAGNLLNWATATETNNNYFTLQRATGANQQFTNIATVNGAGNSITTLHYSYLDQNAPNGISYYRLLQTDYSGATTASEVISVNRAQTEQQHIAVSPVPATNWVNISFNATTAGIAYIDLYDVAGKLVSSAYQNMNQAGLQQASLNVEELSGGIYLLSVTTPTARQTTKLVKE
ncbi:T9SS C-terminal target domain-containing protein [Sphingobacteriales bacterium UPWRP_1]|nr:hypothetical protein BVG80_04675 [Sphingobacteriales bacterium TSM_CSM]PSJ73682.1 T9SS C-terminal target domain-containing protein [Sphingobacteriales bacterium UPWRP_1]